MDHGLGAEFRTLLGTNWYTVGNLYSGGMAATAHAQRTEPLSEVVLWSLTRGLKAS